MKNIKFFTLSIFAALATIGFLCAQSDPASPSIVSTNAENRNLVLEEFTGIGCGNCPKGHAAANALIDQYKDNIFVINYHCRSYAVPGPDKTHLDFRTSYGDQIMQNAGSNDMPSGGFNRLPAHKLVAYSQWEYSAAEIVKMPSYVNVGAKATVDWQSREIEVEVELYYTAEPSAATNNINVAILQNNIEAYQSNYDNVNDKQKLNNGLYMHMHAFRDFLTGQWGDEVTEIAKGKTKKRVYKKTLPESLGQSPYNINLNIEEMEVVVFVAEGRNNILRACKAKVENKNAPKHNIHILSASQAPTYTCDNKISLALEINNKSTETVNSLDVKVELPTKTLKFSHKGEIPSGESTVVLEAIDNPFDVNTRNTGTLSIDKVNSEAYTYNYKNTSSVNIEKNVFNTTSKALFLDLKQDKFGSELSWKLVYENSGKPLVVRQGGPYRDLTSSKTKTNSDSLVFYKNGAYTLRIIDEGKNGINNGNGAGDVKIRELNETLLFENDGKFTGELDIYICVSDIKESDLPSEAFPDTIVKKKEEPNPSSETLVSLSLSSASIYPNPVLGSTANLIFHSKQVQYFDINIYNSLGSKQKTLNIIASQGKNSIELNLNNLKPGFYLLELLNKKNEKQTVKFIKQ